jgi:hypothetical protein
MIVISNSQRDTIVRYLEDYATYPCGKSLRMLYARQQARAIAGLLRNKSNIDKADLPRQTKDKK